MELVVIMFGRDALLIAGSFVMRAMSRPPGSPFFDTTSTATFKITPTDFSKVRLQTPDAWCWLGGNNGNAACGSVSSIWLQGNTFLQFSTIALSLFRAAGLALPDPVFDGLW